MLDRTDKWRNLAPLRFDDYLEADALLAALDRGALDHVRTILHLGACSSTTETDAAYLMRNNTEYTKTLARVGARAQRPLRLRVVRGDLRRPRGRPLRSDGHRRRCGR